LQQEERSGLELGRSSSPLLERKWEKGRRMQSESGFRKNASFVN